VLVSGPDPGETARRGVVSGTGTFKASTGAVDATLTVAGVIVNVR
jgi:hypothetical protein